METIEIYTRTEFARQVGRTKQWVHDKVKRHLKHYGAEVPFELTGADNVTYVMRLVKSGSKLMLKTIEKI